MHTARFIVKALAVLVGLCGALWALLIPVLLVLTLADRLPDKPEYTKPGVMAGLVTATIMMGILGGLMVRQAWIHWRRADRNTAKAIVGIATFVIAMITFRQLTKRGLLTEDWFGPMTETYSGLGLLIGFYLLYRFAFRPLTERAFPPASKP